MRHLIERLEADGSKRTIPPTKEFMRLPGHVINNELYVANRELAAFCSSMEKGNDYDPKRLGKIIKDLQAVHKSAKAFSNIEDVPVRYQYTSNAR